MKKFLLLLLTLLLLCPAALGEIPRVVDEAGLLTADQEAQLESAIALIRSQYPFDVAVALMNGEARQDVKYDADLFYDRSGYGHGPDKDGILLYLRMTDRAYFILTTGSGERIFDDGALDAIENQILPALRRNEYPTAMARFVNAVDGRLAASAPLARATALLPLFLIAGLALGLIVAFSMKAQMKTVRRKTNASSYVRDGSFQLTRSQDVYLYTTTTRQRIETNTSGGRSGSGGGGFTGASGPHHGGRGGHF